MTIGGWIIFGFIALSAICFGIMAVAIGENLAVRICIPIAAVIICIAVYCGMNWYYTNTASGQRAITDQQSELANGLERTITVYTANGDIIASYTGKIDIEGNDGGYVLFDFEGKRYTYYNCFVESIAIIKEDK